MNPDLPYILGFSKIIEIGPVKYSQIISLFGSAKEAWKAPIGDYAPLNLSGKVLAAVSREREITDPENEIRRCEKMGISVLTPDDEAYPRRLKEIYDPPFLLYLRGHFLPQDEIALAVVGSRKMTSYGYSVVESLVPDICAAGLTIVSGLAFGVDAAAHKVALACKGRVIAVLASGVDKITPQSNEGLGRRIIEEGRGAILSEFPLGVSPQPFYFPRRNRIIAGLSLGVLVVEAAENSGSLITARAALESGREVFSIPASIFNQVGRGTNRLIKEGAKMVTKASDILEELNVEGVAAAALAKNNFPLSGDEEAVFNLINGDESHLDELIRKAGKPAGAINTVLTLLEIKGMVKNIGNGYYRKT